MWFEALVPKQKKPIKSDAVRRKLHLRMRTLVADLHRHAETYEASAPSPKVYVRTNTLAKSWSHKTEWKGNDLIGTMGSSGQVAPYNVYARGPKKGPKGRRQAAHMAARGWLSITQIIDKEWPTARKDFISIIT